MRRQTVADVAARWHESARWDHRQTAPTQVLTPEQAQIYAVTSDFSEGCLTHLVRYITVHHPTWRPSHRCIQCQCGYAFSEQKISTVDPAAEMFGCARCIAAAERYGEPTFNLIPSTGCEQSAGRRRGRRKATA